MTECRISIAKQFSRFPAGRYRTDGKFSGQACREDLLVPALAQNDRVAVDLNGTLGYGSSFLEEAFGGLVRENKYAPEALRQRLSLIYDDPMLLKEVWSYIEDAGQQAA